MIDTTDSYTIQSTEPKKKNKVAVIVAIGVILALVAGYLIFRPAQESDQTETPVVDKKESTPTPTEKPKIDKKTVKIQVLNGTGTPGQAGSAVEVLTKTGYDEDNIETDNAEEFDHTTTTIAYKEGFKDVAEDIKKSLGSTFDDVEIESSLLSAVSDFDIVITTGGKIFEESTPTPSAKATPTSSASTAVTPTITPSTTPSPTSTP